jgi:hypothetical protein
MSDWCVDSEPNHSAFERFTWRFLPLLLFGLVGVAVWMGAGSLKSERPQTRNPLAHSEAPAIDPLPTCALPLPPVDLHPAVQAVD